MNFEFATAGQIVFGPGSAERVPEMATSFGSRIFLVTGRGRERHAALCDQILARAELETFPVPGEPDIPTIEQALQAARSFQADVVVSVGGGSVMDSGKVIAALLTNAGALLDYLEVVGKGGKIAKQPVPHIAVPTTAGTGAEVTRNAVIGVPEREVKVSMRSPLMLPTVALVDPLLTLSAPQRVSAASGLDALTQLLESFVSVKANPLTDGICREGLSRAGRALRLVYQNPKDPAAREEMALASLFGGLALANAKLGAVHGFAGPLGGMIGAAHGEICARLLEPVCRANIEALNAREPESPVVERYREAARLILGHREATSSDLIEWVEESTKLFGIPTLSALGLTGNRMEEAVAKAQAASSMKGNPVELGSEELYQILEAAM